MNSIGFGLERIGLAAMQYPRWFFSFILAVTIAAVFFALSITFNGSVTGVLPKSSTNFIAYEKQKSEYGNFSRDVAVIVRSPRLHAADGLDDLRNLQLDLSLSEGVRSAVSIMALPVFNSQVGEFETFFPAEFEDDEQAKALMERLLATYPQAQSLFSGDENAAMILVALDLDADAGNDKEAFRVFDQLRTAVAEVAPEDFEIFYAGLTPIGLTILDTLLNDQAKLTIFGLILGAGIAILFFRSVVAALFCAVPPLLTAIWAIGFFGVTGVSITYMTTILPTLALVLAYADGIVLFHRWNRMNRDGVQDKSQIKQNLRKAILKVGPASALTSLTTAFALSSFALSTSEALVEFAWVGIVLVSFAFISVIVSVPVLGLVMIKFGWISTGGRTSSPFRFGHYAVSIYQSAPKAIACIALLIVGSMFYVHADLEPDYRVTDLLPRGSASLEAEGMANDVFGGRSLVFFSIPTAEPGGITSQDNRERLQMVTDRLQKQYGDDFVYSIKIMWDEENAVTEQLISEKISDAPDFAKQGYLSKDGEKMLVSLRIPSSQSISETQILLDEFPKALGDLEFYDDIVVTGFPVLLATEFSEMINELRRNLLVAAFLGVVLIGIATRSAVFALYVAIPNLFPILFVEAIIYFSFGRIGVTEVVALTLAFGIAIDNAVHLINSFRNQPSGTMEERLRDAVEEVAPALGASTLIICAGTATALTSTLPILTTIGSLIMATLIIALATNLILLPANILALGNKRIKS